MLEPQALFYTCIIPFITFFGLFAFVMYPARDFLHPTRTPPPLLYSQSPLSASCLRPRLFL
jgi:ATP:ADP antiporter, AAA family